MGRADLARLAGLAHLVSSWGSRLNLSGHREPADIFDALIVDALALLDAATLLTGASPGRVADLGSGAGFPGLPLAITRPEMKVELVESRRRRHHFQRAACRDLAITNARPRLGRIEDLEPSPADLVIAQAVGPMPVVAALAKPWVRPGGWLLIPSGAEPAQLDPGSDWSAHGAQRYRDAAVSRPRTVWYARRGDENSDSP